MTALKFLDAYCPYCISRVGRLTYEAIDHPWCRTCGLDGKYPSKSWSTYSKFLKQPWNQQIGSQLYSLYRNIKQLENIPMSQRTIDLINELSDNQSPVGTDDLLELHSLLQEPDNKAQVVATPEDLEKLHDILQKIAADSLIVGKGNSKPRGPRSNMSKDVWEQLAKQAEESDDDI